MLPVLPRKAVAHMESQSLSLGKERGLLWQSCVTLCMMLGFGVVFGGCQKRDVTSRIHSCDTLQYVQRPPVSVDVCAVTMHMGPQAQDSNRLALVSLPDMLRQWAKEHWNPTGGSLRLNFTLAQLSLTTQRKMCFEHSKPSKGSLQDVLQGRMVVIGEWTNLAGQTVSKATWTLYHEKSVPSHYTLEQRQALWYDVYVGLVNQLTQETDTFLQMKGCDQSPWNES